METEKICKTCGKSFMAKNRELKRGNAKYCSLSCSSKAPKKQAYTFVCKHCGKDFNAASSRAKYCSTSCKQKHYRLNQKSEVGYKSIKHYYKVFQDTPCEICSWDKTSRDLHHVVEVSNGGTTEMTNLVCLCPNCHRMVHNNLISKNDLLKIVENRTISSS